MTQTAAGPVRTTRTIAALWRNAAARPAAGPAYLAERDGGWVEVSQAEAARRVDDIANGLLALGVRKGDAFAILGSTSLEWCLFDFALGLIGAIGAPVYANSSPRDCAYVIGHSESVGVLVEDAEQLAKVDEVRGACRGFGTCSRSRTCPTSRHAAARMPPSFRRRSTMRAPRSARTTSSPTSTPRGRPARRRPA